MPTEPSSEGPSPKNLAARLTSRQASVRRGTLRATRTRPRDRAAADRQGTACTRGRRIRPEFVKLIPDNLREGVIYISIPYRTATHRCACGCGNIVVTPLHPTQWSLTYDGKSVSLWPSIGSWSFPCRSHYWIRGNRVIWAAPWDEALVEAGREAEEEARRRYFSKPQSGKTPEAPTREHGKNHSESNRITPTIHPEEKSQSHAMPRHGVADVCYKRYSGPMNL
ncbi:MAG: DUF6527 family protein [Thermoplasmata archaeon]